MFPKPPRPPFIRFWMHTPMELFKRGWNEIPEVMGASIYYFIGWGMGIYGVWYWNKYEKYNRRYKTQFTIYRPDDERICRIRKFDNSPQPTSSPRAIRELYGQ